MPIIPGSLGDRLNYNYDLLDQRIDQLWSWLGFCDAVETRTGSYRYTKERAREAARTWHAWNHTTPHNEVALYLSSAVESTSHKGEPRPNAWVIPLQYVFHDILEGKQPPKRKLDRLIKCGDVCYLTWTHLDRALPPKRRGRTP